MYKIGTLTLKETGDIYYVYEVSNDKYYRLDICKEGTSFHIEPEGILYSEYRRKNTYTYGNVRYKELLEEVYRMIRNDNSETKIESAWKDRKFQTVYTKRNETTGLSSVIKKQNHVTVNEVYITEKHTLVFDLATNIADLEMEPLNKQNYEMDVIDKAVKSPTLYNDLSVLKSRFNLEHLESRDYKTITDVNEAYEFLDEIVNRFTKMVEIIFKTLNVADIKPEEATPEQINKIMAGMTEEHKLNFRMFGADTETTGLDMNLFGKDIITGVVISLDKHHSRYLPFGHNKFPNLPQTYFHDLMQVLIRVQRLTSGHNIKFEHKVAYKYGYDWCIYHDSFEASIVNDPRVQKGLHELKTLESAIDGNKYLGFGDIFIGEPNFAELDIDLATLYCCPDPDGTVDVWYDQLNKLDESRYAIYRLECELANLKAEQEYWGFRIDHEQFIKGLDNCEFVVIELEKMIRQLAGKSDFNLNSADQVINHLYNELGCPIYTRTSTGKPGTGKNAILKLSKIKRSETDRVIRAISDFKDKEGETVVSAEELNNARYPITVLMLAYRKYSKLLTGFYNRLLTNSKSQFSITVEDDGRRRVSYIDENGKPCVRFFFWINANGTESGRQSSTMHTMPVWIKHYLLTDSEEHDMIASDYNQVELRVLPSLAGEEDLVELCSDYDNDIHRVIGYLITGTEMWAISEEERKADKSRNFGVVYKISASGLAEQRFGAMPTKKQIAECEVSIAKFFERFRKIRAYIDNNEKTIREQGTITTMWNRARNFPQVFDPKLDENAKARIVRQGNNMPVQGTAADIMKLSEVKYYKYIKKKGWDKLVDTPQGKYPLVRIMLSIHDEVLISRHISVPIEEIFEMQRECQEIKINNFAPLFANPAVISNWAEGKDDSFEVPKGLRDQLIDDYHRTGKSVLPPNSHAKLPMAKLIKQYKNIELKTYMEGLIEKYGKDPEVVAQYVRHPSLTHDLISLNKAPNHKKISHMERIKFATKNFIEHMNDTAEEIEAMEDIQVEKDKLEESEIQESIQQITGFIDDVKEIDMYGDVVEDEEEEFDTYGDESEEDFIKRITCTKYAWAQRYSYLLDFSSLSLSECDKVLDFVDEKFGEEEGYIPVNMLYGGKIVFTEIKVKYMETSEVDNLIAKIKEDRKFNNPFFKDTKNK